MKEKWKGWLLIQLKSFAALIVVMFGVFVAMWVYAIATFFVIEQLGWEELFVRSAESLNIKFLFWVLGIILTVGGVGFYLMKRINFFVLVKARAEYLWEDEDQ